MPVMRVDPGVPACRPTARKGRQAGPRQPHARQAPRVSPRAVKRTMSRYNAKGKVNRTTCKPATGIAVVNVTPGARLTVRRRVTPTSYRGGGIIVALVAPLPGSAHRIRIGVAAGCPGDIRVTQVRRGDRNPRFDSCQQQVFLEVKQ